MDFEPCQYNNCCKCNHIGDCLNCPVFLWFKKEEALDSAENL